MRWIVFELSFGIKLKLKLILFKDDAGFAIITEVPNTALRTLLKKHYLPRSISCAATALALSIQIR